VRGPFMPAYTRGTKGMHWTDAFLG
jgi:hypothetical protein